jgi:hypothetical protein
MLETELERLFVRYGYQWKIDGALRVPDVQDIRMTIDRAIELLYNESSPTAQIEIGRLVIKKSEGFHDIYCLIGSEPIKEKNDNST